MGGATLLSILVMAKFSFNVSDLLGSAAQKSGPAKDSGSFLEPGLKFGKDVDGNSKATFYGKMDVLSLGIALVLGTAGLPHILTRFYTVPDAKAAQKSVLWAIGIIGSFHLMIIALGFGAAALVGAREIKAQDPSGNTAALHMAKNLGTDLFGATGGTVMLAFIAAVAFATIIAVVAGLTLASWSSIAHDLYANVIKHGKELTEGQVILAVHDAAGKVVTPAKSGALFPLGTDFHLFPLDNPGILSIPIGFFCGCWGRSCRRSTTQASSPSWRYERSPGPAPRGRRALAATSTQSA